ncbi:hypothetical protein [Myxosarcina sp. GI1(2024)]
MAQSYAERFSPEPVNNFQVLNAGSILLVANLPSTTALEPQVHTLSVETEGSSGDETISLTSDQTATFLRKGSVLHFTEEALTVTADTTVSSTATDVPVEALTTTVAAASEATTWALLKILSPMNIPFNIESQTTSRTDLNTIDGSTVKVQRDFNPQIQCFSRPDDKALWEVIFPASEQTINIYAHIVRTSGMHAFGVAQVNGFNVDGAQSNLEQPQFTLAYQGRKGLTAPYANLSTEDQANLEAVAKLSGLVSYAS